MTITQDTIVTHEGIIGTLGCLQLNGATKQNVKIANDDEYSRYFQAKKRDIKLK